MLAWEYARHAWATLYVSRPGTPVPAATIGKVAAELSVIHTGSKARLPSGCSIAK